MIYTTSQNPGSAKPPTRSCARWLTRVCGCVPHAGTTTLGAGSFLSRQLSSFETWRKLSSPVPSSSPPTTGTWRSGGNVKNRTHLNQTPGNRPSKELTGLAFLIVYLGPDHAHAGFPARDSSQGGRRGVTSGPPRCQSVAAAVDQQTKF